MGDAGAPFTDGEATRVIELTCDERLFEGQRLPHVGTTGPAEDAAAESITMVDDLDPQFDGCARNPNRRLKGPAASRLETDHSACPVPVEEHAAEPINGGLQLRAKENFELIAQSHEALFFRSEGEVHPSEVSHSVRQAWQAAPGASVHDSSKFSS